MLPIQYFGLLQNLVIIAEIALLGWGEGLRAVEDSREFQTCWDLTEKNLGHKWEGEESESNSWEPPVWT